MKYKVMYTAGAKKDLRNIFRYISDIFQIYFRGTVSSGECCRTDRADYDGNSEAGYYAKQKSAL